MSKIVLPGDPDWNDKNDPRMGGKSDDPIIMGDAYAKGLTPKTAVEKHIQEIEELRGKDDATFKYASSQITNMPDAWIKNAQATGVSNIMANPMWFSPLHTPQNWQVASKRREIYQWCRFFYENEPKVAAAIDFYSRFPMNGFDLVCEDHKILNWFDHHVVKRLNLNEQLKMISSEYFMLGDVFIHTDIECPECKSSGINPDTGEQCNHPGGNIRRLIILNPDWIEVQQNVLADEPAIIMIPDDELKRIVFYQQPKNIYDRIPDHVKKLVIANKPIPLSSRVMSHIKHMPVPYGTYGSSLIRRLFTTLAYKTKIMTANWIVAERLILPVRVVKIGSDNRPASSADIADIQQQLAATANDPNLTIVTHHNFDYDWYGTSGKVLQITQELEHIDKEILDGFMLNQSLLNGEMCHDEETEVLTDQGWMSYEDLIHEEVNNLKIASYDIESEKFEYQKPEAFHEYDYDGEMYHFNGEQIDIKVTPNHKMLISNARKEKSTTLAEYVKPGARFLAHSKYHTEINSEFIYIDEHKIHLENFLPFLGYYLSEGSLSCRLGNYQVSVSQSEIKNKPIYDNIKQTFNALGFKYSEYKYENRTPQFTICNKSLSRYMKDNFGDHSTRKHIPPWIKNLPVEYLNLLLTSLVNGDGHTAKHKNTINYVYTSVSERLVDDVQEIAFKCGFNVRKGEYYDKSNDIKLYRAKFSQGKWSKGNEPRIKENHINKVHYKGKVWCFTVNTGFFVTRRNGKITIQGNSGYQSAQVGVETLIRRIESWRHTLAHWVEENVFKPIAEMQGFIDEAKSEEFGEKVYLYPTIKWNDLNLKDKTQWHQLLMQLHDKQVISTQTLCEELDLDYDQEVQRMRYEQASGSPMLGGMGAGGAGGDDMGMGLGGGGMGGGMGDMGADPAAAGAMGGAGGDMMGGDMGGGMDAGMGGPMASGMKVMKKGKGSEKNQDMPEGPAPMIKLTSIEQSVRSMLDEIMSGLGWNPMKIAQNVRMQFPVDNPKGHKRYRLDFAFPNFKLGIECDGDYFHNRPEQVKNDKERDFLLAQRGWTILRFNDKTINEIPQKVKSTILSYIKKALSSTKEAQKNPVIFFTVQNGELKDISGEYDRYLKQVHKISYSEIHHKNGQNTIKNQSEMFE